MKVGFRDRCGPELRFELLLLSEDRRSESYCVAIHCVENLLNAFALFTARRELGLVDGGKNVPRSGIAVQFSGASEAHAGPDLEVGDLLLSESAKPRFRLMPIRGGQPILG